MARYAIGDIQGCYHAFQALLTAIEFDENQDQLWLAGDLINRGSGSLSVLRWCYQHQANLRVVLGNHDLHALGVAAGIKKSNVTLQPIFDATDGKTLLNWLRHQSLMVVEDHYAMVHAGLLPQWTVAEALQYAREVEHVLHGPQYQEFLHHMYGNTPDIWQDDLNGYARLRIIVNAMTRMRVCDAQGQLEFGFKGELKDVPDGYYPWFRAPDRQSLDYQLICGHWSALGLYQQDGVNALDSGCLWGGQLTAMNLETKQITQVDSDIRDTA